MAAVDVESITKSFGSKIAVGNLSLKIEEGEIRGLLGPNGSGKSTTMKMIMGIMRPDAGNIHLDNIDVLQQPIKARKLVGYVPETPYLYEYLTASEYLDFVGTAYNIPPEERRQRVRDLLNAFQMEQNVNEVISGFSQGMKQKIALSAALLHRPRVLILDECLNGLDPRSARIVKDILHRLSQEGVAVLFSTHVLEIAEAMCDKVTILNEGLLLFEGTPQELRSKEGMPGSTLEETFLKLTGSEDTVKIVEALRL
ncbi:ABC transporter ATP-binding protein [Candidatus Bathyarchaeota archaeon]|nr:ABC transporter ATP-binding protein [Candidatus Bathyarchaeota archaeon]